MSLLKLLILNIPPPYGGGEVRAKILFDHFAGKEGYRTLIYTHSKRSKSTQGRFLLYNVISNINLIARYTYIVIRLRPSLVFISIPKTFSALLKVIPMIFLKFFLRYKLLGELAGSSFYFLNSKPALRNISINLLKKFDSIRVLGQATKDYLYQYSITKSYVMDNGIAIPPEIKVAPKLLNRSIQVHLLYVGALNENKGTLIFPEIARILKQKEFDFIFDLVGEWSSHEEMDRFLAMIDGFKVRENFLMHGLVVDYSKWSYFKQADLFIFPSFNEGQPIVILEALAFGIPIVSSGVGLIPETITNGINGIIIEQIKGSRFAQEIMFLLNDDKLYYDISANNIKLYQDRYSKDTYIRNFNNWINSFLN